MPITNAPPPVKGNVTVKAVKSNKKAAEREEALNGIGQIVQVPLIATKQFADAGALSLYWPPIAKEVAILAESNEQIAKLIDPLIQVGPYTALIAATLPFVMQLAVNHGMVAPGAMGTVPAQVLSAQIETAMLRSELEAMKAQKEAEDQSREFKAEMQRSRDEIARLQDAA